MAEVIDVDDLLGLGLAPKSAYAYARVIDRAEALLAGSGTDLAHVTPAQLAGLALAWPASRSSRMQLRAALRHAWAVQGRPDGPIQAVRVPPAVRMRCRALSGPEAARLEAAARARGDAPGLAVLVGLYSALRRAEIARLRWDDLSFDGGLPAWLHVVGKGDVAADVPVHPVLAAALVELAPRAGWCFPARVGRAGHVNPTTIWTWVRRVGADAGVDVATHTLRHTALAEANDRSGDLRTVQAIARHARPETTAGYTRTTGERMRRVVGLISYGDVA